MCISCVTIRYNVHKHKYQNITIASMLHQNVQNKINNIFTTSLDSKIYFLPLKIFSKIIHELKTINFLTSMTYQSNPQIK